MLRNKRKMPPKSSIPPGAAKKQRQSPCDMGSADVTNVASVGRWFLQNEGGADYPRHYMCIVCHFARVPGKIIEVNSASVLLNKTGGHHVDASSKPKNRDAHLVANIDYVSAEERAQLWKRFRDEKEKKEREAAAAAEAAAQAAAQAAEEEQARAAAEQAAAARQAAEERAAAEKAEAEQKAAEERAGAEAQAAAQAVAEEKARASAEQAAAEKAAAESPAAEKAAAQQSAAPVGAPAPSAAEVSGLLLELASLNMAVRQELGSEVAGGALAEAHAALHAPDEPAAMQEE